MAFDTSANSRNIIVESVKRHTIFDDNYKKGNRTRLEASVYQTAIIDNLFRNLTLAITTHLQKYFMDLYISDFKSGASDIVDFFRDIANAVCRNNITDFQFNDPDNTHLMLKCSWSYRDFRFIICSKLSRFGEGIRLRVKIENLSQMSDADTDTDVESVYAIIRNLHDRLKTLECQFDRSNSR
jgi:hypothetical protein